MNEPARPVDAVFRNLPRREAEAYFRDWVDGMDARIDRFRRAVAERGGPAIQPDRDSVAAAGTWILDALEEGPRDGPLPLWARRPMGSGFPGRVSAEGLMLLDGLAAFFGESLRRARPGTVRWELNTDKRDTNYQQPVLTGFGQAQLAHAALVPGTFGARIDQPRDDDWLGTLYDRWLARAAPEPSASAAEPIDDVEVRRIEGYRDWDVEIWIPESAEATLGQHNFEGLERRLAMIDGIERLAWEDRERFLARLRRGTDLEALQEAVAAEMRAAAASR